MKSCREAWIGSVISAGCLCLSLSSGPAVAQPPVVHWTFDEPSGTVAFDSGSGDAADGILQSTASRTNNTPGGFSAGALDLTAEGADSWVNGGDPAKVDTLTSFTLTSWILLKGLNADQGGSANVRLLAKQAPANTYEGFSWNLNNPNAGDRSPGNFRLAMFIGGEFGFGLGYSTEDVGADDSWTFVAVTYDGEEEEDNLNFYFGDEAAAVSQLGDPVIFAPFVGPVSSSAGLANLAVGLTDAAPTADTSLNGYQDDIRIYDRVLSLDELEQVRLANLLPLLEGDFNGDGVLDASDIDALSAEVRGGMNPPLYDVTGDNLVNDDDRDRWVNELKFTYFGDADLNGEFGSADMVQVFQRGQFEDGIPLNSGWADGDWNGDGDFDSADFVTAFQQGGYEMGPRMAVQAVPEPAGWMLLALGWMSLVRRNRGTRIRL